MVFQVLHHRRTVVDSNTDRLGHPRLHHDVVVRVSPFRAERKHVDDWEWRVEGWRNQGRDS
jgi:hypothetical protein